MRVKVNLEGEILRLVRAYARKHSLPLGKAVGELVCIGLAPHGRTTPRGITVVNGFTVVDLPAASPKVTTAEVRRLETGGVPPWS